MDELRKCKKCGETKPLSEYSTRTDLGKTRHRLECKVCQSKHGKEYREENKEEIAQKKKSIQRNKPNL